MSDTLEFDPNETGLRGQIFGLPFTEENSQLVLLTAPWEVTTSYGGGTSLGPKAILDASVQVDLFDLELGEFYPKGIYMSLTEEDHWVAQLNKELKPVAQDIEEALEQGTPAEELAHELNRVNEGSDRINEWIYESARQKLAKGKKLGLVGGDHSVPYGFIRAISEQCRGSFGILHVDAHADLREAYQGFRHSHASIMHNVMTSDFRPKKLVQVGVRDFCREEFDFINDNSSIQTFFDRQLKQRQDEGTPWLKQCQDICAELPDKVYISFDIDGLSPEFCPHTGTPVPGGLSFDQALTLFQTVRKSGREIIGFDLVEVAPGSDSEWDANVGARLLFKLCGQSLT